MSVLLPGLDASNPRDYLAAVGLLVVGPADWRISWADEGAWRPTLHGPANVEEVVEVVMADVAAFSGHPVLGIAHGDKADLKLPPDQVRALFKRWMDVGHPVCGWAACLFSELVTDNKGVSKPTGLHFTAGRQLFVTMWEQLQQGLDHEAVHRDLIEVGPPWSKLPSMSWDSEGGVPYALRGTDPSGEKRLSRPGREWLGLRALAVVPSAPGGPRSRRLDTALIRGRWGEAKMTWPVWSCAVGRTGVASLLVRADWLPSKHRGAWAAARAAQGLEALGVEAVFTATILRSDSGGYGSFTPARQI